MPVGIDRTDASEKMALSSCDSQTHDVSSPNFPNMKKPIYTAGVASTGVPTSATGYPIWVFKEMYGPMVKITLQVGDCVTWKRNGAVGCYKGTVVKIGKVPRIRLESHEGRPITPREVNATTGYFRAWRKGREVAYLDNKGAEV